MEANATREKNEADEKAKVRYCTQDERDFLDRVEKSKQVGRDAFMATVLARKDITKLDQIHAIIALIEGQARLEQQLSQFIRIAQQQDGEIINRIAKHEKAIGEETDEIRAIAEEKAQALLAFLAADRAWQHTPITRRRRRDRPAVPSAVGRSLTSDGTKDEKEKKP